ncbi:MAG TPA: pilin [Candidatus Saccharimonadales bacterium]|nr:pilin [Candidatus Saccharimonadales bacterium]
MKKILRSLILTSLFIFVLFPFATSTKAAACIPQVSGQCSDPKMPIDCAISGSPNCCATLQDCKSSGGTTGGGKVTVYCGTTANSGINTAIGCIPFDTTENLLGWILRWAVGVGAGIAFLLIIYAGFLIMTATGDPKRIQAGQELLTSAIGGLILLIFSVFILKFIGVDVLGLCKFGFGVCPT